jgi:hypothetical protein
MFVRRTRRAELEQTEAEREPGYPDGDLLAVLGLFWALSLARVVTNVVQHEAFGNGAGFALVTVLLVPWLMKDAAAGWLHRTRFARMNRLSLCRRARRVASSRQRSP